MDLAADRRRDRDRRTPRYRRLQRLGGAQRHGRDGGGTPSITNAGLAVGSTVEDVGGTFWTGLSVSTFLTLGDTLGDDTAGICGNSTIEATLDTTRPLVALETGSACGSGTATHRGVWVPHQPEDGGGADDRRMLYNILEWVKSVP